MALPVFKTEVFDSEGTLAIIDPRRADPLVQSDAVYVKRLRDLNLEDEPFVLDNDEYQAVVDRIAWVVGLTEAEFTLLVNQ